jgi:DNA repair exonuclease SbcCD nuclease subunit
MLLSRRRFLELSCKSVFVVSGANLLQSFAVKDFLLPPADKVRLRFSVASDGHYGQAKTEYVHYYNDIVQWLNKEKRRRGLHFAFINGDLFHDDPTQLPAVKDSLNRLSMPYYVSHGNHDQVPENEWQKTFGQPWHYSFKEKDIPFIVLNTADVFGTYICPDLAWTRQELKRYAGEKELFVFMHITPIKWTAFGIDCPELIKMFNEQKNLKMIFHGHDHIEDAIKKQAEKWYCFDAHIGGNWGTSYRGYRIVEVLHSGEIITYQMNPTAKEMVNRNILHK